jgi:hypothetical protein
MTAVLSAPVETASRLLESCPFHELRRLTVTESDAEVVLTGAVRSYYLKQIAQEVARPALAGRRLRNRLAVIAD